MRFIRDSDDKSCCHDDRSAIKNNNRNNLLANLAATIFSNGNGMAWHEEQLGSKACKQATKRNGHLPRTGKNYTTPQQSMCFGEWNTFLAID